MMETVISVLALVVSVISAVFTFRLQKLDSRRSTREKLSEAVSELIKLNAENNVAWFVAQELRDNLYYQRLSTITHSAMSLSRQAVYLVEYEPNLVTDVEYATGLMKIWFHWHRILILFLFLYTIKNNK